MGMRRNLLNEQNQLVFLSKDKDGKDLFYPWSKPGEAFYISKTQKVLFSILGLGLLVLSAAAACWAYYLYGESYINDYLFALIFWLPLFSYILIVRAILQHSNCYVSSEEKRPTKYNTFILLGPLYYQIQALISALHDSSLSEIAFGAIAFLSSSSALLIVYILVRAWISKGYFICGK